MNRVAKFEKVSEEQFMKDFYNLYPNVEKDASVDESLAGMLKLLELPTRADGGSAGYDFHIPFTTELNPGESVVIPTGIKCKIDTDWFLAVVPRSSLGFKYEMCLANTVGIIDASYYNNPKNEGHIMIKLCNRGSKPIPLNVEDRFCQGIFLPYGITEDDNASGERVGGIGSSGR